MRREGALAYMGIAELEVDDEVDLLAETEDDICPTCGSLLMEDDEDVVLLHCPVCDRHFR